MRFCLAGYRWVVDGKPMNRYLTAYLSHNSLRIFTWQGFGFRGANIQGLILEQHLKQALECIDM